VKLARLLVLVPLACADAQTPAPRRGPPAEGAHATCRRDQSGIDWVLPFDAARERAVAEQRLLFLKPIAFGTSADGGW